MLRPDFTRNAEASINRLKDFELEWVVGTIESFCDSDGRKPPPRSYGDRGEEQVVIHHAETGADMFRMVFRAERTTALLKVLMLDRIGR